MYSSISSNLPIDDGSILLAFILLIIINSIIYGVIGASGGLIGRRVRRKKL
jgi:hypothetical protein